MGSLKVWNATTSQWEYAAGYDTMPVGCVLMWPGNTPPQDFLIADGTVLKQATWPALFSMIGTIWNTGGEAADEFRLPNLVGKVAVGVAPVDSDTRFNALNRGGGERAHQLSVAELAQHSHGQIMVNSAAGMTNYDYPPTGSSSNSGISTGHQQTQQTGNNTPHENMPPFTTMHYIIKAQNSAGQTTPTGGWWVPNGGTTRQALIKNSNADGDYAWADVSSPVGGSAGQVLAKNSSTDNDTQWKTLGRSDVGMGDNVIQSGTAAVSFNNQAALSKGVTFPTAFWTSCAVTSTCAGTTNVYMNLSGRTANGVTLTGTTRANTAYTASGLAYDYIAYAPAYNVP